MKIRNLLLVIGSCLCAGTSAQAVEDGQGGKPEVVFTGTSWGVQNVSGNGRYICGTRQYSEVYRYDIRERKLLTVPATLSMSGLAAMDVADDGTLVGCGDSEVQLPAVYKDGDGWVFLPMPDGKREGSAEAVSGDGNTIVGMAWGSGADIPYEVLPVVWDRKGDGSYEYAVLPDPETDFLGGKTQFVSPREISDDGRTVAGVMVEENGFFFTNIVWYKADDGTWHYELPTASLCYDADKYQEFKAKEPMLGSYSREEGETYMQMVERFQRDYAKWEYEFRNAFMTGKEYGATPVVISQDGTYMALTTVVNKYTYEEGATSIQKEQGAPYPSLYNLKTKELVEMPEITGFVPYGVSNYGDMIYSDGYAFCILPHDATQYRDVADWLDEKYGFDLAAALPDNTEYVDCEAVAGDMGMIAGRYRSMTPEGELDAQEIFCVLLPDVSSAIHTLDLPENGKVTVDAGRLVFSGTACDIRVYDIAGKVVMAEDGPVESLCVAGLRKGIYAVSALMDGTSVRCKVVKR